MHSSVSIPEALVRALASAQRVAVLTGAGVSAESGVATFRDRENGLWARFDPRDLATPLAFAKNPKLVWDWYAWRRERVACVQPNAGHLALAEIERHVPEFLLITQNVDGLHQRAGSQKVVELHGNIARVRCSLEDRVIEHWQHAGTGVPRCTRCGALLRPDVVWFEETLPAGALAEAERAAQDCDIMLVVGTSAEVYPAAALPRLAKAAGTLIVEINPNVTALSDRADHVLRGPSGEALPALVAAAWPEAATR